MIEPTEHGNNIADQIQEDDAYGTFNVLNPADVWFIIDNSHTHFLDNNTEHSDTLMKMFSKWMEELDQTFEIEHF